MFKSIIEDIIQAWHRNVLYKIIIVNITIFLLVNILKFIFLVSGGVTQIDPMYHKILHGLSISQDVVRDFIFPWTWITYMFTHEGLFHLFFNMLLLFYFGRILGDLGGDRRVLPIYLLSGVAGAIAFIIFAAVFPEWGVGNGYMIGASAAVMGVLWGAAFLSPDYELHLILLGRVKLKWIAVALTLIDFVTLNTMVNTGGHIAHIGGAIMGGWLVWRLREGIDWTIPIQNLLTKLADLMDRDRVPKARKSPLKVVYKQVPDRRQSSSKNSGSLTQQERIDQILDKISTSGYSSLSEEERIFLENMSDQ